MLIAVIGKHWLISPDEEGRRRLDDPEDFVRIEIATALKRGVRVIPVLVDGASIPRSGDLPDDLKPLVRRTAHEVRHARFKDDCAHLIAALERVLQGARAEQQEKERLEAEQREQRRLEAEQRETERLQEPETVESRERPDTAGPSTTGEPELSAEVVFSGHTKPANVVAFSPDGELLASGGGDIGGSMTMTLFKCIVGLAPKPKFCDCTVRLWQVANGKLLREFEGDGTPVTGLAFSPDGSLLASITWSEIHLWQMPNANLIRTLALKDSHSRSLAFSPDSQVLAFQSFEILGKHEVQLWRVSDGWLRTMGDLSAGTLHDDEAKPLGPSSLGCDVAFSPDGVLLATGSNQGLCLWRVCDGLCVFKREGKGTFSSALTFSPDGSLLASSWSSENESAPIVLWSIPGGEKLATFGGGPGIMSVKSISFSPDGSFLASAQPDAIYIWRVADGKLVTKHELPSGFLSLNGVHSVSFSPNGAWLAAACDDHLVRLWALPWSTGQ